MKRDMKQWMKDVVDAPVKRAVPVLSFPAIQLMGIMVGDGEGNMNFSAPLTRAHLATILARLHGGSGQVEESRDFYTAQCKFQDVPDWARQYAGYCAYHGLMVG